MTNGLSGRWMRGNLLVTVLLLVGAEALLMLYTINSGYAAARQTLRGEMTLLSSRMQAREDADVWERATLLRGMLQEHAADDGATCDMQLLDEAGGLYATSLGLLPTQSLPAAPAAGAESGEGMEPTGGAQPAGDAGAAGDTQPADAGEAAAAPEDFALALTAEDGIGESMGTAGDGTQTLALTWLLPVPVPGISAVRLVTSLEGVRQHILQTLGVSLALVASALAVLLLTGAYFVRSIVRPLAQLENTAKRIAGGNFDIRLQKRHNDEIGRLCETINHMAEELSKTERLKNEFISSVSHELRTPLTSIRGWTETLRRIDDVHDPNYAHGMRIIAGETYRLNAMVEELLDFSRMQSRGLELHPARLDLAAEVSDAVLTVQQRAVQAGLVLRYAEPAEVLPVQADAARLRQVFINVLDNAIKYSPPGGTVTVDIAVGEGMYTVSVADQGPGIAPDERELVKTRFYKGRGALRGSGIGLAVVDEILRGHGGGLRLEEAPGGGALVLITLPAPPPANA